MHLHAQVLGHKLGARHNGNVLQQGLASLAKGGALMAHVLWLPRSLLTTSLAHHILGG
jgi:hypothetical protein